MRASREKGGPISCGIGGRRAYSEPSPHPSPHKILYISPLKRVQIFNVKIGKTDLYLLLFSLMLCFLNAVGFNWCISVWWVGVAHSL